MIACGLDFGTSNSGVALPARGGVRLVPLEDGATSMPTAVFFGTEEPLVTLYGRAAVSEYLDGTPGRLMRSLKSLLGSGLMEETTAVGDRNIRYTDIVTLYLRTLRTRASEAADATLDTVVLGRPVRFVDDDAAADGLAQDTLAACAREAGFRHIEFQLEPIAAALDYERTIAREEVVLVIDVGGGTADFSLLRVAPERGARIDRTADVLANDGIHIAGTDFDTRLNLAWIMPALGYGATGPHGKPVPSLVYFDLSTWHRINFLYTPRFSGALRELQAFFDDPLPYRRLARVIERKLGHQLLGQTEQAKIELSAAPRTLIDLREIERGLAVPARQSELLALLERLLARLVEVGRATVRAAGLRERDVATLYFTGGSSGMTALRAAFEKAFPASAVTVGDLFGSVVSGLGLDAGRRFGPGGTAAA
ncbi:MAG TPA: Hsp70 family protein [Casimicrobiaceae bacterium]|nr:Hsp70 family protein [Casimicrobiaceae bacterium]